MKKQTLVLMLSLVSMMAFGQSSRNQVTTTGNNGAIAKKYGTPIHAQMRASSERPACAGCEVDQIERPDGFIIEGKNKVSINQVGEANEAKGEQSGLSNMSLIRQDNTTFSPGASGNLASTEQIGNRNGADIKQFGDDNTARIWQRGNDNYARQDVGDDNAKHSEGNLTYSAQLGNGNSSYQKQRYDNNEASSYQIGNGNAVVQHQSSGPNGSSGSEAFANQVGEENSAQQNQEGSFNYASVYQTGNGNVSVETQYNATDDASITNISTVNQVGNGNKSCVTQNSVLGNNCSLVNQLGDGNSSVVGQMAYPGSSNSSCVLQQGTMNKAQVIQTGNTGGQ